MIDHAGDARADLSSAFAAEALPHLDRLFRLAMWMERDRHEAEEVVQETLLRALRAFDRYAAGTNCRAWLIAIMQNVRRNRYRARRRRAVFEDREGGDAESVEYVPPVPQVLTDQSVLAALEGLPAKYQEVILLSDVEELSYKDIARALDVPIGTVMSRLHRGRSMLRKALAADTMEVRCASSL